jgi:hypothetical protein
MNPFLLAPTERLRHWKDFRRGLMDQDTSNQIAAVAEYWSKTPLGRLAYDPVDETRWLSPWELIYNNQWCRSSVAIGMESTLRLAGITPERLRLQLFTDTIYDVLLVLIVDDTFVLNYDWGSVCSLPLPEHEVIREWRFIGRGYFQSNI